MIVDGWKLFLIHPAWLSRWFLLDFIASLNIQVNGELWRCFLGPRCDEYCSKKDLLLLVIKAFSHSFWSLNGCTWVENKIIFRLVASFLYEKFNFISHHHPTFNTIAHASIFPFSNIFHSLIWGFLPPTKRFIALRSMKDALECINERGANKDNRRNKSRFKWLKRAFHSV